MLDDLYKHVFLVFGVKWWKSNQHFIAAQVREVVLEAYIRIPKDHQSAVLPCPALVMISGGTYSGVPTTV